jgi:hypothetical protein
LSLQRPQPPSLPLPQRDRTPPPNSGIKTLILTNRERFNTLYGAARTNTLFSKLVELSNNPYVQGEIIDAGANNSVASQYSDWVNHLDKVVKANQVASEIRSMAFNYLDAHSSVNYILIVGDDQIIPFRRIADRTNFPESSYTFVDPTTPWCCGWQMTISLRMIIMQIDNHAWQKNETTSRTTIGR